MVASQGFDSRKRAVTRNRSPWSYRSVAIQPRSRIPAAYNHRLYAHSPFAASAASLQQKISLELCFLRSVQSIVGSMPRERGDFRVAAPATKLPLACYRQQQLMIQTARPGSIAGVAKPVHTGEPDRALTERKRHVR